MTRAPEHVQSQPDARRFHSRPPPSGPSSSSSSSSSWLAQSSSTARTPRTQTDATMPFQTRQQRQRESKKWAMWFGTEGGDMSSCLVESGVSKDGMPWHQRAHTETPDAKRLHPPCGHLPPSFLEAIGPLSALAMEEARCQWIKQEARAPDRNVLGAAALPPPLRDEPQVGPVATWRMRMEDDEANEPRGADKETTLVWGLMLANGELRGPAIVIRSVLSKVGLWEGPSCNAKAMDTIRSWPAAVFDTDDDDRLEDKMNAAPMFSCSGDFSGWLPTEEDLAIRPRQDAERWWSQQAISPMGSIIECSWSTQRAPSLSDCAKGSSLRSQLRGPTVQRIVAWQWDRVIDLMVCVDHKNQHTLVGSSQRLNSSSSSSPSGSLKRRHAFVVCCSKRPNPSDAWYKASGTGLLQTFDSATGTSLWRINGTSLDFNGVHAFMRCSAANDDCCACTFSGMDKTLPSPSSPHPPHPPHPPHSHHLCPSLGMHRTTTTPL